jgi:ATP-dependent DNA helicase DinG
MSGSPALVAAHGRAVFFTADGEILTLPAEEAAHRLRGLAAPLVIHAPATFRRLGLRSVPAVACMATVGGNRSTSAVP